PRSTSWHGAQLLRVPQQRRPQVPRNRARSWQGVRPHVHHWRRGRVRTQLHGQQLFLHQERAQFGCRLYRSSTRMGALPDRRFPVCWRGSRCQFWATSVHIRRREHEKSYRFV
ncbi:unnamed protein product, partial [Nesidiocoris tenuis]